jgi:hypothetical protein
MVERSGRRRGISEVITDDDGARGCAADLGLVGSKKGSGGCGGAARRRRCKIQPCGGGAEDALPWCIVRLPL